MKTSKPANSSFHFEYEDTSPDSLLTALEQEIGGNYHNGIFQVPPSIGAGNIGVFDMEDGLYLRYFYFTLSTGLGFQTKVPKVDDRFFNLYYQLDALPAQPTPIPRFKLTANTVFMSNNLEIQGYFNAGTTLRAISILFTPEWLEKNKLMHDDHIGHITNDSSSLLLSHMSLYDYTIANNTHKFLTTGETISLQVRLNCLMLVNRFFADIAARKPLRSAKWRSVLLNEISKPAGIPQDLEEDLPGISF